ASLGADGSTAHLVSLFTSLLIGLGAGINVPIARHYGAGQPKGTESAVHTALVISILTGIVICIAGYLLARPVLVLFGTKPELLAGAVLYVRLYFLGIPAMAVYNFGSAVYDAVGNPRRPLFFLLLAGILNVLLNLFFVIVLGWDVAGVAVASAVSQIMAAVLVLRALMRETDCFAIHLNRIRMDPDKVSPLLSIGLTSGLQTAIFPLANLFIQSGVNRFDALMVAGNAAAANADSIVYGTMDAFYIACSSFMSQNFGAGKKDRVIRSYLWSLGWSFGSAFLIGLALFLQGPSFLGIFSSDPAVISCGLLRLNIMAFSYPFSAFMDCTIAASRSLGLTTVPTVIVIFGSCLFRILWVKTVFAHFGTIPSLYLLYIFSWGITAVFEILYFVRSWKRISRRMDLYQDR
ncbi:MAG: MATE family efflux transporter, partial [Clostridia bacterium]|nr:MATE family efflux transporter [Clostridia bacterium]